MVTIDLLYLLCFTVAYNKVYVNIPSNITNYISNKYPMLKLEFVSDCDYGIYTRVKNPSEVCRGYVQIRSSEPKYSVPIKQISDVYPGYFSFFLCSL